MADTTLSKAVAAPITHIIGGTTYTFSPMKIRALGELEQWIRGKIVALGRDAIRDCDNEDDKRIIMAEAFNNAACVSFMGLGDNFDSRSATDEQVRQRMANVSQMVRLVLQSIDTIIEIVRISMKANHPRITAAEVEQLLDDPALNGNDLVNDIMRASGLAAMESKDGGDPKAKSSQETA